MKIETVIWLFPIAFMIHDFEEIIFLESWITKNESYLKKKLPRAANKFVLHAKNLSTASFASAVAEIFIILSLLTLYAAENENYSFFIALIIVNLLHIIIHFIQGIFLRKYIPAIGTGILTSLYCIYAIWYFNKLNLINWKQVTIVIPFIVIGILVNLLFSHFIAKQINKVLK